ncbi:MAG: alpha/beta fold hydrolase [Patescibacteria group bacterium]
MINRWLKFVLLFLGLCVVVVCASYLVPLPEQEYTDLSDLVPSTGHLITVQGIRTFVEDVGPRDGEVVLLIHGFGGGTFNWRYTIPALSRAGYRAIAFDLKGFHLSDKSGEENYSLPSQAAFVSAVLDELGIERFNVVGHSMGAHVAALFALQNPDRVKKLIIVDGAIMTEDSSLLNAAGSLLSFPPIGRWAQIYLRSFLTREEIGERLGKFYHDRGFITDQLIGEYAAVTRLENWDAGLIKFVKDSRKNTLERPLSGLAMPVLIIWGSEDEAVPVESGNELRAQMPSAEWTVFSNAGHVPMEERSDAFNVRLLEFLRF